MRRRLLVVSMTLVGVVLLALMVPLLNAHAEDRTQDLFVGRLGDVTRFAVLAEDALEGGGFDGLTIDLQRYVEVYGGQVVVTNANREVVASAGAGGASGGAGGASVAGGASGVPENPQVAEVVDRALSGSGSEPPRTAWPWVEEPVVIGSPVGRDAQVLGAVVLVAPTSPVQESVSRWLLLLVVAGLATLLLTAYGVVVPFVGWILRPVHELDLTARRLAHGELSSRVPHKTGPPELQDLATSFNVMADHVETSQQQQRDLVADAAHQLGNPLTALRLRVENLGVAGADPDQVDTALEETDRLNTIVESLLDLSQVGAHRVETGCVDVAAQTRHRCEMWAPMFERLDVESPPSVLALASDDIVDVVLDALLDNAAKFAAGAPVEVAVTAPPAADGAADGGADGAAGEVLLRVRDHGPGLDAEDVEKVGARFFRGRQHQNVAGTGLGLAIVRARVLDIGGALEVSRPEGGGLQVAVRLPAFRGAAPGSSASPPDAGPAAR
ncbi:HAMP domain-containing histidine kinase [Nocardioides sp. WL0053]|uniref:Signal transduction histidine-protein kinase/phosphatase MprB n=1 Tax=Nocardioides jiangsuensis TaxID=2866161 RepID=A0ABS7RPF7_9ACTN|nr:HAMP domain-containing sensor histidine kinase [Nocardioides jiangsuensis]MBY9075938.1 HAMP domain-containing histidine kinase [Nocardioides jiangsuensis]